MVRTFLVEKLTTIILDATISRTLQTLRNNGQSKLPSEKNSSNPEVDTTKSDDVNISPETTKNSSPMANTNDTLKKLGEVDGP
jgi:hypothetical protein